jgi:hypothetical protein
MKRNSVLKVLNPILGILLVSQVLTGLLSDSLPPDAFEVLHEGGGIALGIVGVAHTMLNWNWIKANYFRKGSAVQA